jgi:hypothetical protein
MNYQQPITKKGVSFMNSIWLKTTAVVVLVVAAVILANKFSASKPKPKPQTRSKTFYDVADQDDQRLRAEPEPEQVKQQFEELTPEQQVDAERLFEMALAQRKMGRLPGVSYKLMVDYCRQIIAKYPDSVYAFKARRMLGDIPQQYRKQYDITEEEINPSD